MPLYSKSDTSKKFDYYWPHNSGHVAAAYLVEVGKFQIDAFPASKKFGLFMKIRKPNSWKRFFSITALGVTLPVATRLLMNWLPLYFPEYAVPIKHSLHLLFVVLIIVFVIVPLGMEFKDPTDR